MFDSSLFSWYAVVEMIRVLYVFSAVFSGLIAACSLSFVDSSAVVFDAESYLCFITNPSCVCSSF